MRVELLIRQGVVKAHFLQQRAAYARERSKIPLPRFQRHADFSLLLDTAFYSDNSLPKCKIALLDESQ